MNDSTVIDSLAVAANKVVEQSTNLSQVLHEIAPVLYFVGAVIILATAFFIWDAKSNK